MKKKPAAAAAKKPTPAVVKKPRGIGVPAVDVGAAAPPPVLSTAPRTLPFGRIVASPLNPRKRLDKSREALLPLARSIGAKGVLENLLVRPLRPDDAQGDALYEIIAGERRWRAVNLAVEEGLLAASYEVPVAVIDPCSDAELVELAGTENIARDDMEPLDVADLIAAMRSYHKEDGEIMRRLGIPERTFYRRVALLRLAPPIQRALREDKLTQAQASAYALGEPKAQMELYNRTLENPNASYYREPANIKTQMTHSRVPVARATFDRALYTGEIISDPDSGEAYFADAALFNTLQEAAIKEKVAALKSERYAFVKKIEAYQASDYAKAMKGAKGAGAVWYVDTRDGFVVKAPVVAKQTPQGNQSAKPLRSNMTKAEIEKAEREAAAAAAEEEREEEEKQQRWMKIVDATIAEPKLTLAMMVVDAALRLDCLEQNAWDDAPDAFTLHFTKVVLAAIAPAAADALDCRETAIAEKLGALDADGADAIKPALYRAVAALDLPAIVRLYVTLSAEANLRLVENYRGETTTLGAAFLQRELPLVRDAAQ